MKTTKANTRIVSSKPLMVPTIGRPQQQGYIVTGDGWTAEVCRWSRDSRGNNSTVRMGDDTLSGIVRDDGMFSGLADVVARLASGETDAKIEAERLGQWYAVHPVVPVGPAAVAALIAADLPGHWGNLG